MTATIYFAYRFKVGTYIPLQNATGFILSRPIVSEHQHQSWNVAKNGRFFDGRVNSFAHDTRFTVTDSLYSRPVFPLSNGVYRMSLRLFLAEQSARDPSDAAQFLALFGFSVSNVKPMAHVRTCQRHPIGRRRTKMDQNLMRWWAPSGLPCAKFRAPSPNRFGDLADSIMTIHVWNDNL